MRLLLLLLLLDRLVKGAIKPFWELMLTHSRWLHDNARQQQQIAGEDMHEHAQEEAGRVRR